MIEKRNDFLQEGVRNSSEDDEGSTFAVVKEEDEELEGEEREGGVDLRNEKTSVLQLVLWMLRADKIYAHLAASRRKSPQGVEGREGGVRREEGGGRPRDVELRSRELGELGVERGVVF